MRSFAIGVCVLMTGIAGVAAADAPFSPLKRISLLEQPLPSGTEPHYIKGGQIDFAPGQPTGPHRHPVAVIGIVTEGSFVFQPEGQTLRTLKTGDAFYDPARIPILHFDNASRSAPAQISAFYLLDSANQPVVEMLQH